MTELHTDVAAALVAPKGLFADHAWLLSTIFLFNARIIDVSD